MYCAADETLNVDKTAAIYPTRLEQPIATLLQATESAKTEAILPNGATTKLGPSAHDAYAVFEDLCLLANSEHPRFLKLDSLRKTFALELIESVLTNYHDLFRKVNQIGTGPRTFTDVVV